MSNLEYSSKHRPFIFLAIGIFNTVFDFLLYTFLTQTILSSSVALAGVVSGTVALAVAFVNHSLITWRGAVINRQTPFRFILFTGFGMWVIRPVLLWVFILLVPLYTWVHSISAALGLPFSLDFVSKTGAFAFMAAILLIYNYLTYDRFVFMKTTTESSHEE